jgi:hypothetical protein
MNSNQNIFVRVAGKVIKVAPLKKEDKTNNLYKYMLQKNFRQSICKRVVKPCSEEPTESK